MSPDAAVIEGMHVVILATAVYLASLLLLGAAYRVTHAHPLARAVAFLAPRALHRSIAVLLGIGALAPMAAVATPASADAPVIMRKLPEQSSTTITIPSSTSTTDPPIAAVAPPAPPPFVPAAPPRAPNTWTIKAGEHFWAVAEAVVTDAIGHDPTPTEVIPYWQQLIDANRDRLRDPANPSLVFPGQELLLPPLTRS